jgi:PAS domain S-box-containing protein
MFKKYQTIRSYISRFAAPGRLPARAVSIASIVLICGICWLDIKTSTDIRFRILYIFPLMLLALHARRRRTVFIGFALAASCEVAFLLSTDSSPATQFIEALVGITGFLLVVVLARTTLESYLQLRLRSTALEAAANAIVITDYEGTIVWVNPAFTAMTSYSKEEIVGKNTRVLKSGEQPESYYAKLWSTISSGEVWQGEIVNRRKDGTTYTEEMTITPVTPDVCNPANKYFIAIKQDITERKQTERALWHAKKERAMLIDGIVDYAILMLDSGGHVVSWNAGAERLKGYRADEIIGQHFSCFHREEDVARGRPLKELETAVREGRFEEEGWRVRKDGSLFWANVVITPLRDETGQLRGFSKVTHDITERKRAQEKTADALLFTQKMLDTSPLGIITYRASGEAVAASPAAGRLIGASTEQIIAQNFRHLESWQRSGLLALAEEALATSASCHGEVRMITTFGKEIWVNAQFVSFTHEDEPHLLALFEDISERKLAEAAQREAEQKYRMIYEGAVIGIFQSDVSGHYLGVNPEMARMFGYDSPQELLTSVTDISRQVYVDPKSRQAFQLLMEEQEMIQNFE